MALLHFFNSRSVCALENLFFIIILRVLLSNNELLQILIFCLVSKLIKLLLLDVVDIKKVYYFFLIFCLNIFNFHIKAMCRFNLINPLISFPFLRVCKSDKFYVVNLV